MHSSAWKQLVRRIPPEQHNSLVLVTTIGQEFSLQTILRLEEDYLVVRGRVAGTTDTGRVFFIPYDQINYVGFQSEVKEAQIDALYGERGTAAAAVEQPSEVVRSALAETAPSSDPVAAANPEAIEPPPPGKSSGRLPIPSKKALLERLRLRNRSPGNTPSATAP